MSEDIRLQVFLSRAGASSRRGAVELITQGRVQVNGKTITEPGARVAADSRVSLDGQTLGLEQEFRYIMLHKPVKTICSTQDPEGRMSVYDIISGSFPERMFSIGRLDYMTSGLLLLTNDGNFANTLSHPRSGVIRKYEVESRTILNRKMLEDWKKGVRVQGVLYRLREFEFTSRKSVLLTLEEGKNREIRNVFAHYDQAISRLHRVQFGNLSLTKLKPGRFRELSRAEVDSLAHIAAKQRKPRTVTPKNRRQKNEL